MLYACFCKRFLACKKKMKKEEVESLIKRSSKLVGCRQVMRGLSEGAVRCVIVAEDADAELRKKVVAKAKDRKVDVLYVSSKRRLGEQAGVEVEAAAVGIISAEE